MACVLALGLATGVPVLLARSAVWEVPISCGYMFTMLALGAIWCAMHEPERRCRWLVAASAAYGLAVGARPSLLFGAVILLMPMALAWREGRRTGAPLLAAIVPILLIGLGLMVYNELRFDSPFEFGLHYQLSDERRIARQFFSVHHLWFNFRMYFLEPTQWKARFPFMQGIVVPPIPPDHGDVEHPFGVLTNVPLVWLALAAPLAWRDRSEQAGRVLRWFVTAVALLFGIEALTLGLYYCTASRFEVEFLPELLLLAVVGILGLERALAPRPTSEPGLAGRPWWLCAVRCGWSVLLGFSVMFNLSAGVGYYAEVQTDLGNVLLQAGNISEAFAHYQQALRIHPSFAGAHEGMGMALAQVGRLPDAIQQYEQALRSSPDYVEARLNLGNALLRTGKVQEAVEQYGQALRINPDYAEAHGNLGAIYQRMGKLPEAVEQYEQALRSKPDYVEAHFNLGLTLEKLGRTPEAIEQFKLALKFRPDFAPAKNALTRLGVGQ
jgi:tetratricopeptide (TPR) repeat protein